MTRAGTVPLSDIESIKIYFNTKKRKSTKTNLKKILKEEGGDFIMNAAIFLRSGKPCCHLKADGVIKCKPNYSAWAIAWNEPTDFHVQVVPDAGKKNYMECVHVIIARKKIQPINCGDDMKYKAPRTAVGVKDGRFAYYVSSDKRSPEELRDLLYQSGWSDAIMMDGGGSSCFMDKDGNGFSGDGRYIPFFIIVTLKPEQDPEPKGEKPMVEINAYSKAKQGNKKLSTNFAVKEFACNDGSDAVFVAPRLVMILQSIRSHFGKAVTINSAYRTTTYNKKVGGATESQHCYGTAADISIKGVTPKQIYDYAESLMPDWGGVGLYDTFCHVDVREAKSRWKG